jgi:DNA repair exonuclease SbcCD ATPase subunit
MNDLPKEITEEPKNSVATKYLALAAGLAAATPSGIMAMLDGVLADLSYEKKAPLDLRTSSVEDLLGIDRTTLENSPLLSKAAMAIAALRALVTVADDVADTTKKNVKTLYETKMNRALEEGAKRRKQLEAEISSLVAAVTMKEQALVDLKDKVDKEALLIPVLENHVHNGPVKGCVCAVCRMHASAASLRQTIEEQKEKIKEQKDILKGFQGPRSKHK